MNAVILITILLLIVFGLSLYFIHRHYEHLLKKEVKRAQKSERIKSLFYRKHQSLPPFADECHHRLLQHDLR